MKDRNAKELRYGWTTGACATAATKAALIALFGDDFPDPVTITLPRGQTPAFALATEEKGEDFTRVSIIKDAGDDPDVTHLARIISTVRRGKAGGGIVFLGGEGVGTVTREGLPIAVGEPAINPVPRKMLREVVNEVTTAYRQPTDIEVEISVENGAELATHTMNGRLGIIGGLSILGLLCLIPALPGSPLFIEELMSPARRKNRTLPRARAQLQRRPRQNSMASPRLHCWTWGISQGVSLNIFGPIRSPD